MTLQHPLVPNVESSDRCVIDCYKAASIYMMVTTTIFYFLFNEAGVSHSLLRLPFPKICCERAVFFPLDLTVSRSTNWQLVPSDQQCHSWYRLLWHYGQQYSVDWMPTGLNHISSTISSQTGSALGPVRRPESQLNFIHFMDLTLSGSSPVVVTSVIMLLSHLCWGILIRAFKWENQKIS